MPDTLQACERRESLTTAHSSIRQNYARLGDFARWTLIDPSLRESVPAPAPRRGFRRYFR